jgi:predicted exporter/lauroyl/myristoyl acyltransferase
MKYRRGGWVWLLAALLLVVGLSRVRLDVDVLGLLPPEVPAVQGLRLYQENFAVTRDLIVTVSGPDAPTTERAAEAVAGALSRPTNLTASVDWRPPWLEHPGELAALVAWLWLRQPPESFQQLAANLSPPRLQASLAEVRDRLGTSLSPQDLGRLAYDPLGLTEPLLQGAEAFDPAADNPFASADGAFRLVWARPATPLRTYVECEAWLREARRAIAEAAAKGLVPDQVTIRYTGGPAFVAETARSMEKDLSQSVPSSLILIGLLFGSVHRRLRPLLAVVALLVAILCGTLGLGGLFMGKLNVVSLGFAAILMGLAVDYSLVLYQEALAHPEWDATEVRRAVAPSILWAATTTSLAFFSLRLAGLPGLSQLGTLVGAGVLLAALVMLSFFLRLAGRSSRPATPGTTSEPGAVSGQRAARRWVMVLTAVLGVLILGSIGAKPPSLDHSPEALRPRHSEAYAAMEEINARLLKGGEPFWLVVEGRDPAEVRGRLLSAEGILSSAKSAGLASRYLTGAAFWPGQGWVETNAASSRLLAHRSEELRAELAQAGFRPEAFGLAERVLQAWTDMAGNSSLLPANRASQWILEKLAARRGDAWLAAAAVYPADTPSAPGELRKLAWPEGSYLSGWGLLAESLLARVQSRIPWLAGALLGLLVICLVFAFGNWRETALSLSVLALAAGMMLSLMSLLGWTWNLMNLVALPLVLGAGIDYPILVQLSLRRHGGTPRAMWLSTGRAILLCAGTTIIGFGSLAFANNAGLASLGLTCALGVACVLVVTLGLLPDWWLGLVGPARLASGGHGPSWLYRAGLWQLGVKVAGRLPRPLAVGMANVFMTLYGALHRRRREIVKANLRPVLDGGRLTLDLATLAWFRNLGVKMVDLWRFEAGVPLEKLALEWTGWETFQALRQGDRAAKGILLLTPHLGNWELGGPLLASQGVKLVVVTQPEPGEGFTEMRRASRARWGIETVVIGEDPFAFVQIIQRLEAGATVALLIDRPQDASAVTVELFGQPFQASIAPAELARASGCALVTVCILRTSRGYRASLVSQIDYDRAALGTREARRGLTQRIMTAFEPVLRTHCDQWFHCSPLWASTQPAGSELVKPRQLNPSPALPAKG